MIVPIIFDLRTQHSQATVSKPHHMSLRMMPYLFTPFLETSGTKFSKQVVILLLHPNNFCGAHFFRNPTRWPERIEQIAHYVAVHCEWKSFYWNSYFNSFYLNFFILFEILLIFIVNENLYSPFRTTRAPKYQTLKSVKTGVTFFCIILWFLYFPDFMFWHQNMSLLASPLKTRLAARRMHLRHRPGQPPHRQQRRGLCGFAGRPWRPNRAPGHSMIKRWNIKPLGFSAPRVLFIVILKISPLVIFLCYFILKFWYPVVKGLCIQPGSLQPPVSLSFLFLKSCPPFDF